MKMSVATLSNEAIPARTVKFVFEYKVALESKLNKSKLSDSQCH